MSYKEIGTIRLTKGYVTATDPCYDKNTWCTVEIKNVLAGNWKAYIKYSDDTSWGDRISELVLVNENYNIDDIDCFEEMEGEAGVDAGLCGFFEDKPDYNDDAWDKLCDNEFEMAGDTKGYPNYGIATLDNNFKCVGAWSSSGYGDGGYPVYTASDKSGYVIAMKVVYIDDEEYEDDISDDLIDEYDDFEEEDEVENEE